MSTCGSAVICMSVICFLIGGVMMFTRGAQPAAQRMPVGQRPRRVVPPRRPSPIANTPPPAVQRTGDTMQDKFFNARLGQTIVTNHPQRGSLTGQILGTIRYAELWQRVTSPSEPWVTTGNQYAAHWMGNWMLYEWQGRLYLLDEAVALSDQDIQQQFLPYAKQFAQSNQTAKITFAWPPATWTMADIGKFRVERAEGQGLRLTQGAEGRFIHATGADNRALVVEDYQSGGGGQDTAWIGWQIDWEAVTRIG